MFYVRPRRYYKSEINEVWSMEYDIGEGFIAEDVLALEFAKDTIKALLIVRDENRVNKEEYKAYCYALFSDLVDDSEKAKLKIIHDKNVYDYWPEEIIGKLKEVYGSK